jgi:hypothetical protein
MNFRAMALVTAAITAELLAPNGESGRLEPALQSRGCCGSHGQPDSDDNTCFALAADKQRLAAACIRFATFSQKF